MKTTSAGALSGCIVWTIVFGILSLCFLPMSMMIGGFTSVSGFAMQTVSPLICPEGTTAKSYSYATTTTDEFGNSQPSTAYEIHCIDAMGIVVKEDPVLYAFLWIGIIAGIGLVIAATLAFALAAPAGMMIARVLERNKKPDLSANIEPE